MKLIDALRSVRRADRALRYTSAIALGTLGVAVAVAMEVLLQGPPTAPVFAAVLAAAWLTGFGPAIVTASIGVIALDRMGEASRTFWHVDMRNVFWMLLFLGIVLGTAWLVSTARRLEDERGRLLAREQESRTTTEAVSRAKDEFLAMVSHELRNPLSAILSWVHLLRNAKLDPSEVARAVDVIEQNTVLQAKLIDDLLDVSRAVAGKLDIAMHPVDLTDVVRHAVHSLEPKAVAAGVTVETTIASGLDLLGDATRLEQVVVNLVSNAIKFTPPGGHVYVHARRNDRHVELLVRDTGQGIDAATLPHVFELFHQAPSIASRRREGLGLGLAIARHIVERHGGSIAAESAGPGRGATFLVSLAAEPAAPR
ncbi:MAG: DUF4118 domain-containing protein [Candidatus Rokubacteria bacterium]|nr:DUF4118 domain-containing protein [Candidatus Rokubacteria bacterium]